MILAQNRDRVIHTVEEFRNKKTIIIGEVNTGKTACLGEILDRFMEAGATEIAVIDMAPERVKGIGGKMRTECFGSISYYTAQIVAPRLMGKTEHEVQMLAEHNVKLIDNIFAEYLKNPCKVLFINDVSLYLQAGDPNKLFSLFDSSPTVIINGYYGYSLGGGKLGKRERENMNALRKRCDRVISSKLRIVNPEVENGKETNDIPVPGHRALI